MLSYRHSYHAGNFADVLKHVILIEILEHLVKKDTPFDYIDTHAGAGLYSLESEHAEKIQEYKGGIGKINFKDFPELAKYHHVIGSCNADDQIRNYPGSPYIVQKYLRHKVRKNDRAWLYEMHPADYKSLDDLMSYDRDMRVERSDGFTGLLAKFPPLSKRGFVLIDPSYEIKEDYNLVFEAVARAYKKFATGTYAIWYPVVDRRLITQLEKKFRGVGIKNIQQFELGICQDGAQRGMTSSGMIIINPPWTLLATMKNLLPKLARAIGQDQAGVSRSLELTAE